VLSAVLTIFEIGRPWIFLKDAKGGAAAPPAPPKSATGVTCRLTAKKRDQLRNPTLGNRVWATFTLLHLSIAFNSLYCFILILYLNTGKVMLAVFSTASRAQQTLIRPALDWKCENGKNEPSEMQMWKTLGWKMQHEMFIFFAFCRCIFVSAFLASRCICKAP